MKTTDIYGLPYIEADDLVSAAPAQFKTRPRASKPLWSRSIHATRRPG